MRCGFKCAWLDDKWVHVPATERIKKCAGITQASTRNIKRERERKNDRPRGSKKWAKGKPVHLPISCFFPLYFCFLFS
jgi:hypothetical protein